MPFSKVIVKKKVQYKVKYSKAQWPGQGIALLRVILGHSMYQGFALFQPNTPNDAGVLSGGIINQRGRLKLRVFRALHVDLCQTRSLEHAYLKSGRAIWKWRLHLGTQARAKQNPHGK